MFTMKRNSILSVLLISFMVATTVLSSVCFTSPVFAGQAVKVTIDGTQVYFPDQKPVIVNSRTLVPVRFVSEELGATVEWKDATRDVVIRKGSDTITMRVDTKTLTKNGVLSNMDVAPTIMNGRTMVPLRFVSENLGVGVRWIADTYTVEILTTLKPGNLITLPADADAIDRKIQELALDNSSWGNLYTADREVTKDYISDLAEIGLNLNDATTERSAAFLDMDTKDGYVMVLANSPSDTSFGTHDIYIYQRGLTMLCYDGTWAALTSLFTDEEAAQVWDTYLKFIHNVYTNTSFEPVNGTVGGYSYSCHLSGGDYAISFDR